MNISDPFSSFPHFPSGNQVFIYEESFKKFNTRPWPGNQAEANLCLDELCSLTEKEDLLFDERLSLELQNNLSNWNLTDILFSILVFKYKDRALSFLDWTTFFSFFLHPKLSDPFFSFLKYNEFNEIEQKDIVLVGAKYFFERNVFFYLNEKGLTNFFDFLKIDSSISSPVISKTLLNGNFKEILKFLEEKSSIILPASKKEN